MLIKMKLSHYAGSLVNGQSQVLHGFLFILVNSRREMFYPQRQVYVNKHLLDDIYDLIIAFDDKALTVVNDRYPFIMYKEADYADELAAIKTAIDALPAELQPGLNTYVIKGTSTAFPLDENYAARQLRYDVLAQALVAAANVDAAIVAVPEIALYLDLVANGTVADPDDYITIATDLTAALAAFNTWCDTYDMIWAIGTDGELDEITALQPEAVIDPNVAEMIENYDVLMAALEKFDALQDSTVAYPNISERGTKLVSSVTPLPASID